MGNSPFLINRIKAPKEINIFTKHAIFMSKRQVIDLKVVLVEKNINIMACRTVRLR